MNRVILLILIITLNPFGCNETEKQVDVQNKVNAFIIEMNPDLYQSMTRMRKEITLADTKIQQLYELKGLFPNQREMIDKSLKQWHELRKNLKFTLNNIYDKVEAAYVAYKIDEIQGKKKFSLYLTSAFKRGEYRLSEC
ncbi:hypothetical protein PN36_12040 [Candidatus Thiomargarita nelsonii]|uniref:Uncharacterized protein n=1 Tax=Candidatus Thiomargarita nelsonii TaxID=1003181 RepID=A0A0A6S3W0_9GAMM|nr:hypothetical protein PN36_12040 [Candidatus Thiomargarita nelsonii]